MSLPQAEHVTNPRIASSIACARSFAVSFLFVEFLRDKPREVIVATDEEEVAIEFDSAAGPYRPGVHRADRKVSRVGIAVESPVDDLAESDTSTTDGIR